MFWVCIMKLKYYLRGIGIGVIIATLIMMISGSIHKEDISDETIIKEALKLGMIMPEDTEKDSIWQKNTESETSETDEEQTDLRDLKTEAETEGMSDSESETDSSEKGDSEKKTEDAEVISVTIEEGDGAGQVSKKLYQAGLVEDRKEFHEYITEHGYSLRILIGTFEIEKGSTYKEICEIITR